MFVKPVIAGSVVRDPTHMRPLPESGGNVDPNAYWLRRIRMNEVVEVDAPVEDVPLESAPVSPVAQAQE